MKIQLDTGEAQVYVTYGEAMAGRPVQEKCRATFVLVKLPSGIEYSTQSICHPPDQFVRKVGRSIATRRMSQRLRMVGVAREDRKRILGPLWRVVKQ